MHAQTFLKNKIPAYKSKITHIDEFFFDGLVQRSHDTGIHFNSYKEFLET